VIVALATRLGVLVVGNPVFDVFIVRWHHRPECFLPRLSICVCISASEAKHDFANDGRRVRVISSFPTRLLARKPRPKILHMNLNTESIDSPVRSDFGAEYRLIPFSISTCLM
jgi:hypothetical protein